MIWGGAPPRRPAKCGIDAVDARVAYINEFRRVNLEGLTIVRFKEKESDLVSSAISIHQVYIWRRLLTALFLVRIHLRF